MMKVSKVTVKAPRISLITPKNGKATAMNQIMAPARNSDR